MTAGSQPSSPASTLAPPPSPKRVLRALFWRLLFRGRSAAHAAQHGRSKRIGLGWTLVLYALLGLLPALTALVFDTLAFASTMHSFTLLFASLTLAASAGSMLFMREEAEILLHRPVRPEQVLRAKSFVLISFALLLAAALNAAGFVTGIFAKGSNWLFLPAHATATLLLMVFSAAAIVLVYMLCLRWFGREKLDNLLTMTQVLLAVVMIAGSQLMPSVLASQAMQDIDPSHGWALLLPPVWFAAIDVLLCGAAPLSRVWLPAAIGVVLTAATVWLAFVRLGSAYGTGLQALNESTGAAPDRAERRFLSRLVQRAPLRWWLRDGVQRQAFLLTSAYLGRDRETKLKLYPGTVPMLVLPLVMALGVRGKMAGGGANPMDCIAMSYLGIVPLLAMTLLQRSEHWRAAANFRLAPIGHWTPLFHGARKAVLCWLALPCTAFVGCSLAVVRGSLAPLAVMLVPMVAMPAYTMIPGLARCWLPLSLPNEEHHSFGAGCLMFGVVIAVGGTLAGLAAWMRYLGWFWPYLLGVAALSIWLQRSFARRMRKRPWPPSEEV